VNLPAIFFADNMPVPLQALPLQQRREILLLGVSSKTIEGVDCLLLRKSRFSALRKMGAGELH